MRQLIVCIVASDVCVYIYILLYVYTVQVAIYVYIYICIFVVLNQRHLDCTNASSL